MEDHSQTNCGGSDPSRTLTLLPEHQDSVGQTYSVQYGRNSKPEQWHKKEVPTNLSQRTENEARTLLIIQTCGSVLSVAVTVKSDAHHNHKAEKEL
jgi:hypothetical protein